MEYVEDIGDELNNDASDYGVADAVWPTSGSKYGWECYVDVDTSDKYKFRYSVSKSCNSTAQKDVFSEINRRLTGVDHKGSFPGIPPDYYYGLVMSRKGPLIMLSVKISRRREDLLATSMFVSEVRFQGDGEK